MEALRGNAAEEPVLMDNSTTDKERVPIFDDSALRELLRWRHPHLLLKFAAMHRRRNPQVHALSARALRALLAGNGRQRSGDDDDGDLRRGEAGKVEWSRESIDDIRFGVTAPANDAVLSRLDPHRRSLWCSYRGVARPFRECLGGENNAENNEVSSPAAFWVNVGPSADAGHNAETEFESLFMVGEDSNTCQRVTERNAPQNKALLGYCLQGNVKLATIRTGSPNGKIVARAVLRLLVRVEEQDQPLTAVLEKETTPNVPVEEEAWQQQERSLIKRRWRQRRNWSIDRTAAVMARAMAWRKEPLKTPLYTALNGNDGLLLARTPLGLDDDEADDDEEMYDEIDEAERYMIGT